MKKNRLSMKIALTAVIVGIFCSFGLSSYCFAGGSGNGVENADIGARDSDFLRRLVGLVQSGAIPEVNTQNFSSDVQDESMAESAFKYFLDENDNAKSFGKGVAIFPIKYFEGHYFTVIKGPTVPYFLIVKQGERKVFMVGTEP